MERDLTVGKPITAILKYTLPLFGSIIFQQLYNIADSLVAGRYIGTDALAAVGNGYEITLLFIAFLLGAISARRSSLQGISAKKISAA